MGVTLFDTADVYPKGKTRLSEELLGKALGRRRDKVVVATKFGLPMEGSSGHTGASRGYILRAVEDSLRRLGTDRIDLYQLHAPDATTPIEETLQALDELVKAGKVRYIGCSNFAAWQLVDANWRAKTLGLSPFVAIQNEYSLVTREPDREVVPACTAQNVGFLPFFPLASGLLTGKYRPNQAPPSGARLAYTKPLGERFLGEANREMAAALQPFAIVTAGACSISPSPGCFPRPVVSSVIAGASNPEQMSENVEAGRLKLSSEDLAEIDRITGGDRYKQSHG